MKYTLAISSYNRLDYLQKTVTTLLDSLKHCTDYEVLIVDSSTKEEIKEYLKSLETFGIRVHHKETEAHGEAPTHNMKFSLSKWEYIFHSCDDYLIENPLNRNWLKDVSEIFDAEPLVGVVMNEHRYSGWKYPQGRLFWDGLPRKQLGDSEYVLLGSPTIHNYPVVGWTYRKSAFDKVGEFRGQGYKNTEPVDWYHTHTFLNAGYQFAVLLNSATTKHIGDIRCY